MSNENKVRLAHELLDEINARQDLTPEQTEVLRSFLPELPKQKTLEELRHEVYDAWIGADGNEWPDDAHGVLETWLAEFYAQLKGVEVTAPAHPEFLETEADYAAAPEGTVVVKVDALPWVKEDDNNWTCPGGSKGDYTMSLVGSRRVLRWGWGE